MEVLVVKWTQKEGTLIRGKFQIRMLGNCLKQAVEDIKNLLMQENSFNCAEVASVSAVLLRLKVALEEQKVVKQVYIVYDVKGVLEEFARIIKLQQVTILNAESKYAKLQEGMGSYNLSMSQASRVDICSSTSSTHILYPSARYFPRVHFLITPSNMTLMVIVLKVT